MPSRWLCVLVCVASLMLQGCDPVVRHRILTTIFEDVPSFPPVEQLCQEAQEEKLRKAASVSSAAKEPAKQVYASSTHQPYGEKRCNNCHEAEKSSVSGLLKPENELCFMCHKGLLDRRYAHGPAAEGGCLGCHLPHEANYPSLLSLEPGLLCEKCHGEPRLAADMHNRIKGNGIICTGCHDPHSGDTKYFLK